jgi:hypothetical protein
VLGHFLTYDAGLGHVLGSGSSLVVQGEAAGARPPVARLSKVSKVPGSERFKASRAQEEPQHQYINNRVVAA